MKRSFIMGFLWMTLTALFLLTLTTLLTGQNTAQTAVQTTPRSLTTGRVFMSLIDVFSQWCIPLIIFAIAGYAYFLKKVKVFEVFVEGAKEGFNVAVRIIPYLVAILFTIGIFRAGGAEGIINGIIAPVMTFLGVPPSILPLCLIRPLSGAGARGVMIDIFKQYGPDSMDGLIASVIQGSTETTFYVIAVYLGSIGVRKTRYAVPACLTGDIAGMIASVIICKLWPWPF
jgi:spore maturation protein B